LRLLKAKALLWKTTPYFACASVRPDLFHLQSIGGGESPRKHVADRIRARQKRVEYACSSQWHSAERIFPETSTAGLMINWRSGQYA